MESSLIIIIIINRTGEREREREYFWLQLSEFEGDVKRERISECQGDILLPGEHNQLFARSTQNVLRHRNCPFHFH